MGVQGVGGCAPFTLTEVSLFEKGRPSPTLIKAGVERAQPHPRGVGGCAPRTKKRERVATLATCPRGGPKTLANPKHTGAGKRGVQGGKATMAGGLGGCPPTKPKIGGELPTLATQATSGTQNAGKPSANGGGQMGVQGVGGCAPFTLTEVSLFEKGRPSPTLIKAGVERAQPHPRGSGGCAPRNRK
jgi:hypothetical protein